MFSNFVEIHSRLRLLLMQYRFHLLESHPKLLSKNESVPHFVPSNSRHTPLQQPLPDSKDPVSSQRIIKEPALKKKTRVLPEN
jgi:hypothetical protein